MIVIADRASKEQWTEIVAHREAQQALSVQPEPLAIAEEPLAPARGFLGLSWSARAGILLFLAASCHDCFGVSDLSFWRLKHAAG